MGGIFEVAKGTRTSFILCLAFLGQPQHMKFPILSRLALDLMAVPAMSTEIERVFSG